MEFHLKPFHSSFLQWKRLTINFSLCFSDSKLYSMLSTKRLNCFHSEVFLCCLTLNWEHFYVCSLISLVSNRHSNNLATEVDRLSFAHCNHNRVKSLQSILHWHSQLLVRPENKGKQAGKKSSVDFRFLIKKKISSFYKFYSFSNISVGRFFRTNWNESCAIIWIHL